MRRILLLVVLMVANGLSAFGAADPLPTVSDINADIDSAKYTAALQKLARVMQLKGDAARGYDHVELLVLKGETHLQLKQIPLALEAYTAAAKEAKNRASAGPAIAMEMLIKRQKVFMYTPKPSGGQTAPAISILDRSQRKTAFKALLADELVDIKQKINAGKSAQSLAPVMDVLKSVGDVQALEIEATGEQANTKDLLAGLADHARVLIAGALKTMQAKVADVSKAVNVFDEVLDNSPPTAAARTTTTTRHYRKRGLTSAGTNALKDVLGTCDRIEPASKELAAAAGTNAKLFDAVIEDAAKLRKTADAVLTDDYTKLYTEAEMRAAVRQQQTAK